MRVLVTGGAGFIGSHVADAFKAAGHEVAVLDNLSSGTPANVGDGIRLFEADITDDAAVQRIFTEFRPDLISHHAAQMDVRRSVEDPRFDAQQNIIGTLTLLENARTVGCSRFLFASTGGAIYGDSDVLPTPETEPTRPVSPYGISKLAVEKYLYYYEMQYGFRAVCLRYGNVFGPRQNPHGEAGVIAIFLNKLLAGETPTINGSGEQTRDYVYVGDVARASVLATERLLTGDGPWTPGEATFNIGAGRETSLNELIDSLLSALGEVRPDAVRAIPHGPAKSGEQMRSAISPEKAGRGLGWAPQFSVEQGLRETVRWFADHRS